MAIDAPRLLVVLPQLPRDPASGAARTANTIGELLADAGFSVEVIATTSTEGYATIDDPVAPESIYSSDLGIHFHTRRVSYSLIDTGEAPVTGWQSSHGDMYDKLYDRTLARFRPDLVFTYGGSPADIARQKRAKSTGARVIFGLYNTGYCTRGLLDHVDAIITPSNFLSRFYRDAIDLHSTPLPTPLALRDVVARARNPTSLTIVNPSLNKGLILFANLAGVLGKKHPEIPIEVYPSRVSPQFLIQASFIAGIDLTAHPNLKIHTTVPIPATIYRKARVLLVPSLVRDAAPRVIAEAFVNGIPPVGSDRGGIPEMCAEGGFVLPVPPALDSRSWNTVRAEFIEPWINVITALFVSTNAWRQASERARRAGALYLPSSVTSTYVAYFEQFLVGQRARRR